MADFQRHTLNPQTEALPLSTKDKLFPVSETAAYFHLTEKYLKIIEAGALKTLRDGMNDGEII